jgi:glycosyltransferase involved in cell wall biosynthesis
MTNTNHTTSSKISRIVHIAKMTNVSGMERHLQILLPGLRKRGLDVSLIVLVEPDKPMDSYIAHMQELGVPAESMVIRRDLDLGLIRRLAYRLRSGRYDAVHTHLIHADLHGMIAARIAGIRRRFFTSHNDDSFRHRWPIRLLQWWLWRQVDAGIAISSALRDFVIKYEFAPADRVHTVHYGLDPASMTFDPDAREILCLELGANLRAPLVGSLCRLTEQKGISYAIRAFWQIAEQMQGAQYVILGDGPLLKPLRQEVEGFGIKKRVHFLGWREDATSLLGGFDVIMMPSLWEGFGMVALEAMAAGKPIVASHVSALPEIVENGLTGYLAEPGSPSAFAECLLDLLQNPAHAREMGEQGRQRLETMFSVDKMLDGTLNVYMSGL